MAIFWRDTVHETRNAMLSIFWFPKFQSKVNKESETPNNRVQFTPSKTNTSDQDQQQLMSV